MFYRLGILVARVTTDASGGQLFVKPPCVFSAVLEICVSEYQIISFGIKVSNHTALLPLP